MLELSQYLCPSLSKSYNVRPHRQAIIKVVASPTNNEGFTPVKLGRPKKLVRKPKKKEQPLEMLYLRDEKKQGK